MMRKEDQLHALTHITPAQAKGRKMNNNQWAVYFFLLSISDYNSKQREDHRYVYKSEINVTQLSEQLNFKRQTYYNILDALRKRGLVVLHDDYIELPLPSLYTKISKNLMGQLLSYYNIFQLDLLRTYLFFNGIYQKYGSSKPVTTRNIVRCLGHSEGRSENYRRVEACKDLLAQWKLIDFHSKWVNDPQLGLYETYIIHNVAEKSEILDKRFNSPGNLFNAGGLTPEEEKAIANELGDISKMEEEE